LAYRSHLSIGEVLSLLQDEFPDVTISKIRFLESQGLVDPERTPSGYRKFYEEDIERLRWILRQQRDAFLPLKVIKGRLEGQGRLALEDTGEDSPGQAATRPSTAPSGVPAGSDVNEGGPPGVAGGVEEGTEVTVAPSASAPSAGSAGAPAGWPATEGARLKPEAGRGHGGDGLAGGETSAGPVGLSQSLQPGKGMEAAAQGSQGAHPGRPSAGRRHRPNKGAADKPAGGEAVLPAGREGQPSAGAPGDELSMEELAEAAGVGVEMLRELERYGLISPRFIGGLPYYSPDAAVIARLAGAFARHGVEARHLRAYKGAAEREAGMVQQVVMPLIRQRNPEARRAALQAVDELSALGGELRAVLLREALADLH
jgi:DNA-binding transcriptional MerR regulator